MEPIELPNGIHDPHRILLWRADDLVVFIGVLTLGVMAGQLSLCAVVAVITTRLFRRFRDSHPDGFLYHWGYWYGLSPLRGYSLLNPFKRRFLP